MDLLTFQFKEQAVRVEIVNNEPYFCLKDVANILSLANTKTSRFSLNEKGVHKMYPLTKGGKQELTFINEPNLYRVIFRSNKTEAKQFQDWVFEEVLPSIRQKGHYLSYEQRLENLLQHTRFLLTFDNDLNINMEQVPIGYCAIDPKDKNQAMSFINEWVPQSLLPDLLKLGIDRLCKG